MTTSASTALRFARLGFAHLRRAHLRFAHLHRAHLPHAHSHLPGLQRARAATVLAFAVLLAACGGGGVIPVPGVDGVRPLGLEFTARKAVAYSPFRTSQKESDRASETITAAMVKQDLDLLVLGKFGLIRVFDSSDRVSKLILQVIKDNKIDIKMMLGIFIQRGDDAFNQAEMARGVALAKAFPDTVLSVSVGNETMVSWSFNPVSPALIAGYLKSVRSQITQPVTTDDNWAFFAHPATEQNQPDAVLAAVDFVSMHSYALIDSITTPDKWNWQQTAVAPAGRAVAMMDAALAATTQDYTAVRSKLDGLGYKAMPIVIGETGWKAIASGSPAETFRAHPVNQKMYFDRLATLAGPKSIVYFQAFDEPWKQADDKWGLFNVNRQARYVVQSLYDKALWEPGNYSAADALYYIPVLGNGVITANRYTLYADAVTAGEAKPTEAPVWNAWDSGQRAVAADTAGAPADLPTATEITPIPAVWGWGMTRALPTTADNLSNFEATGTLNFSIKTSYAGKIEVGFLTGSGSSAYDVYLTLSPGQYGYANDGAWHAVAIPISEIKKAGAKAFGNENSATSVFDLSKVTNPFVIADRYAKTGKADGSAITTKLSVDGIYWAK